MYQIKIARDGKSRGKEPYYCPKGWKRIGVQFYTNLKHDFDTVYDNWPIAYHGTKFDFSLMITLSGLRASGGPSHQCVHGEGVYLSPSIKYVAHPRYAQAIKLDLDKPEQREHALKYKDLYNKYNGKWVQLVLTCRVKPGSYRKHRETMGLGTGFMNFGTFDDGKYWKSEIEWVVPEKAGNIVGTDRLLIYGYMIKVSNTMPRGYR